MSYLGFTFYDCACFRAVADNNNNNKKTAKVLGEFREGAWDKAARDPNDEMVSAGLTPDNIRKWEYLKGIQAQNETVCTVVVLLMVELL